MKRTAIIAGSFLIAILALVIGGQLTRRVPQTEPGAPPANPPAKDFSLNMSVFDPHSDAELIRISAALKDSAEIKMTGKSRIEHSSEFGKGTIRVPIAAGAAKSAGSLRAPSSFPRRFEQASYRTFEAVDAAGRGGAASGESARLSLPGNCTGTFDDGTVVRFKSLDVNYQTHGLVELKSSQPVQIEREAPFLRLSGKAGLTGKFDRKEGIYRIDFPAPVYAFMRREAGQAFLGLRGSDARTGAAPTYICVKCDGVLTLDWGARRIVFDRNILIAPTENPEVPVAAGDQRIECHRLTVSLDPAEEELAGAVAERGPDLPVRAVWGTTRIESGKAAWDAAADTAELTDGPHMWSKTKDFRCDTTAARILMDNRGRLVRLFGPIKTFIDHEAPLAKDRLPSAWDLDADYGEVRFNEGKGFTIKEITASADPALPSPKAIRFLSRKEDAVRAEGGKLRYDVESQVLVVTGVPPRRPFLHIERPGEKLMAEAERVSFFFREGGIVLEERVEAKVTQKSARAGEHVHRLNAHWVRIAGRAETGVSSVTARAKDAGAPLCLEYDGPPRCRLIGGSLLWEQDRDVAIVSPFQDIAAQRIEFLTGELRCRELRFMPAAAKVSATGEVAIRLRTERGEFTISADAAECAVDPAQLQDGGPPALTALRGIKASAGAGRKVVLQGDALQAEAGELDYDALDDILLLKGPDRQRFRYTGPAGADELAAQTVTFVPSESRVTLSGGVAGLVHQRNWGDAPQVPNDPRAPSTPWRYEARTAQVQLRREGSSWLVAGLTAQGDVRLANDEMPIHVTGDQLAFDPGTQTITLGAPRESASFQTIRYGVPPEASWLNARTIKLQRREQLDQGKAHPEIFGVMSEDVTCIFHLRSFQKTGALSELVPDKITVNADRVNLTIPADRAPARAAGFQAEAVGHVGFRTSAESRDAPAYFGSGARADYQHNPFRFRLRGDQAGGKAVLTHPMGAEKAYTISIRRRSDGSLQYEKDDSLPGVENEAAAR